MRRFVIFAGYKYYPGGGMSDFDSDHDDRDEALSVAKNLKMDWVEVIDTDLPSDEATIYSR